MKKEVIVSYDYLEDINSLSKRDQLLLKLAREKVQFAYAPYSKFSVAACALLDNDEIVYGVNCENASYSVSICAERSLLSSICNNKNKIVSMAISYKGEKYPNDIPISPCGVCRQALYEYETNSHKCKINYILSGQSGSVLVIDGINNLLPLAFNL